MFKFGLIFVFSLNSIGLISQLPIKHRILINTNVGGTNLRRQSINDSFIDYSNKFNIEKLVFSPSYGKGSKKEILRIIDYTNRIYQN